MNVIHMYVYHCPNTDCTVRIIRALLNSALQLTQYTVLNLDLQSRDYSRKLIFKYFSNTVHKHRNTVKIGT